MSLRLVLQRADTMERVSYVHRDNTESLLLEDNLQMKQFGFHQPQEVGRSQAADELQLLVIKKEVSELRSSNLDQENPELLQIKKEEDELWIIQNGEQLTVKIVDDERLQLSELHLIQTEVCRETESTNSSVVKQMEAEPDREYCGGTELNRNPDPAGDGAEWQEARMKQGNDEADLLFFCCICMSFSY
ncbi:hypothetical protein AMECASPLE_034258 [Ameca splendens]|uniref:Uncharacterized protein n=1 Tax=Ameca splendens TaxID=208324 RepID=A0ABV1A2F6_9TELE